MPPRRKNVRLLPEEVGGMATEEAKPTHAQSTTVPYFESPSNTP